MGDAIDPLTAEYPDLSVLLFEDGRLNQYVNVFHNCLALRDTDRLGTEIKECDEITLFPPVSEG